MHKRPPPRVSAQRAPLGETLLTRLVHHRFLFVGFLSVSLQCQPGYLTSEFFPLGCSEDSKWGVGVRGAYFVLQWPPCVSNISASRRSLCVDKI